MNVGNLISGSSAFSKSSLYTWTFLVHLLLKTSLKDFECYLASMWNECHWVGHDWVASLSHFTFMHWRRKWQPTPVFLPGESQGRGSRVGYHLWGRIESDMTEVTWWWWRWRYGSLKILRHCLSLGLVWKLTFSSPVGTAEFSKFAGIFSAAL